MSKKQSAGLVLFRKDSGGLDILLVHPGGPFWTRMDDGAWSIPKGEFRDGEDPLGAAKREFQEETGAVPPIGALIPLDPVRQPSGKTIHAWGIEGDFDVATLKSNLFSMEWPPKSARQQNFPEVDRAAWFPFKVARRKIQKGQLPFLTQLETRLGRHSAEGRESKGPANRRSGLRDR